MYVQVSLVKDRKTLVLYLLHDPDNPVELAFQQRYGHIATYQWSVTVVVVSAVVLLPFVEESLPKYLVRCSTFCCFKAIFKLSISCFAVEIFVVKV